MDNYTKGEVKELPDDVKLPFVDNVIHMKVNAGSKLRNLIGFAVKKIKENEVRQMTWNASGQVISKAISCAEIMKKRHKGLHQVTNIRYKRIEEYWEPKTEGLDRLKVNRDIPAITILLSKDPLDDNLPGYQPPGSFLAFWNTNRQKDGDGKLPRKNRFKESGSAKPYSPSAGKGPKSKQKKTKSPVAPSASQGRPSDSLTQSEEASLQDLMAKIDALPDKTDS